MSKRNWNENFNSGAYCKTCGIEIASSINHRQKKTFNREHNILHCQECSGEEGSKYNLPIRKMRNEGKPITWAKLREKRSYKWRNK